MSILIVCSSQFLVSTIVQVVRITLSLHAATKISSRAQGILTVASRWHVLMTCSSNDSPHNRSSDSLVNFEAANRLSSLHTSYSQLFGVNGLCSCAYKFPAGFTYGFIPQETSFWFASLFQFFLFIIYVFEKMALLIVIYGFRLFISRGSVLLVVDCSSYSFIFLCKLLILEYTIVSLLVH